MQYEIGAECNDGSHAMLQGIDAKCNKEKVTNVHRITFV